MKSQARLRLRQAGKHTARRGSDVDWVWRLLPKGVMARAFEMNCAPKHSTEENVMPFNTMNYASGRYVQNFRAYLRPIQPSGFIDLMFEDLKGK